MIYLTEVDRYREIPEPVDQVMQVICDFILDPGEQEMYPAQSVYVCIMMNEDNIIYRRETTRDKITWFALSAFLS